MTRKYSVKNRTEAAVAIFDIDSFWADTFSDTGLSDLNYCDLFTQMWLKREQVIAKTELYNFMPNISPRTAVKYVQNAIDEGMLVEVINEQDRRVRFVSLSNICNNKVESFLDFTCQRFKTVGVS
ncbi:MAG: MarR family transcriptional regulator [Oleibacter sp.]|nr:MarR family transcriptional regulator [Thalassolituus sp.]